LYGGTKLEVGMNFQVGTKLDVGTKLEVGTNWKLEWSWREIRTKLELIGSCNEVEGKLERSWNKVGSWQKFRSWN